MIEAQLDEDSCSSYENEVSSVVSYFKKLPDLYSGHLPDEFQEPPELQFSDKRARDALLNVIQSTATLVHKGSSRIRCWKNLVVDLFLPFLFKELWAGRMDEIPELLIGFLREGLLSPIEIEIHLCPEILALTKSLQLLETVVVGVSVMASLAKSLGRDFTSRVFLDRFLELCRCNNYYIRQICAATFNNFVVVLERNVIEERMLPQFLELCADDVWLVRRNCTKSIVFLSYFASPSIRKSVLTPVFLKFLEDDWFSVKAMAYRYLGLFITTFASPPRIKCISHEKTGDLAFATVDNEQVDFQDICSLAVMGCSLNHLNNLPVRSWVQDYNKYMLPHLNIPEHYERELTDGLCFFKSDYQTDNKKLQEFMDRMQKAKDLFKSIDKSNTILMEEFYGNIKNEYLSNDNEKMDVKEFVEMYNLIRNQKSEENRNRMWLALARFDVPISMKRDEDDSDEDKVNTNTTNEEDGLSSYNSYNYWYISPELPLDPRIINDGRTNLNVNVINQTQESNNNFFPFNNNDNNNAPKVLSEEPILVNDIVPEELLKKFTAMVDFKTIQEISPNLPFNAAYYFPAVTLTLGANNWPILNQMFLNFFGDENYEGRQTVASYLHELANILGIKKTTQYLEPTVRDLFNQRGANKEKLFLHLPQFLKFVTPFKRKPYLSTLTNYFMSNSCLEWRKMLEITKQLSLWIPLFKALDVAQVIAPIAQMVLEHPTYVIRKQAIILTCQVIRYISSDSSLVPLLLIQLAETFGHSKNWRKRQVFAQLCGEILRSKAVTPKQFSTELMPHFLDLSWDPIANVRLVVAKVLKTEILSISYFVELENPPYENLDGVLQRLQADKDKDVRFNAESNCVCK